MSRERYTDPFAHLAHIEQTTSIDNAHKLAQLASQGLENHRVNITPQTSYLALGAGMATAELAFAEYLGIDQRNVTLLDRGFTSQARERFGKIGFQGSLVEDNMFTYLESDTTERYDIASALAVEFRLVTEAQITRMISGLSQKLRVNGVAMLDPVGTPAAPNPDMMPVWEQYGFEQLHMGVPNATRYMMIYKPAVGSHRAA